MTKLTKAQLSTLDEIARWQQPTVRFQTGEALRRKGLVERITVYEIGWDFADQKGVHPQSRHAEPRLAHRWAITRAGRLALQDTRPAKENEGHG